MTAVFVLRRSEPSFAFVPVDVWSSMITQAELTLDDKCAVRSTSARLRRLVNAVTTKVCPALPGAALPVLRPGQHRLLLSTRLFVPLTSLSLQVKLDLADELQHTLPPGLRPYVERVCVRATTHMQLEDLDDRLSLSGVPSAAALELDLSFGRNQDLYLITVWDLLAGLTERVRAVKYCCRNVFGTHRILGVETFPGRDVPVFAELGPAHTSSQPASLWQLWPAQTCSQPEFSWQTILHHSLVELQITVSDPEAALRSLKYALRRRRDRFCGTLRCLQVNHIDNWPCLPMHVFTEFLAGLELPCLVHLGTNNAVTQPFQSMLEWPQKESVPMLQSFGCTRKPKGIFGLGRSGVHMPLERVDDALAEVAAIADALGVATTDFNIHYVNNVLTGMAAMADSALGPAIRDLHVRVKDLEATWEGVPAAMPFHSLLGFLATLKSLQQLSIKGLEGSQLLVRAEAINVLDSLQTLALKRVTVQGDLTGPRLTEIVCLDLQTQLCTVLARPPPALASILVPHEGHEVVPRAVLGIDVPRVTEVVRACPGGPCWKVSHETCWCRSHYRVCGLVTAVPCGD